MPRHGHLLVEVDGELAPLDLERAAGGVVIPGGVGIADLIE